MLPHTEQIHAEPNLNNVQEAESKSEITGDLSVNMSAMFALYTQQNSKMTDYFQAIRDERERWITVRHWG